jgi:PTH1 family peptidyl-tRNA hydrolase
MPIMDTVSMFVGLGNPGPDYSRTRHNAGFWFIDALAEQHQARWGLEKKLQAETAKITVAGRAIHLVKPATFMNHSGRAVLAALQYWKVEPGQCLLAHDELDLAPGVARLKFDGGHGGQNGLRDTMALLGHGRFHRLRIGIGHPGHKDKVTPWVLGRPGLDDGISIARAIEAALAVVPHLVEGRLNDAMKQLHTPAPK